MSAARRGVSCHCDLGTGRCSGEQVSGGLDRNRSFVSWIVDAMALIRALGDKFRRDTRCSLIWANRVQSSPVLMNPPQASAASNLPLAQALEAKSLKDLDQDSPVATRGDSLVSSKSFLQKLGHWPVLAWTAIAVSLIGCQSLVASGLHQPRLTVMLPFGAGDDRLRQQFLRGFSIGEASVKACGVAPARVGWLALPPDASPDAVLPDAIDHQLVVAPPAADLRAFGRFAERRQLSVLLPYQRGASLTVMAGLEGFYG